MEENNIESRKLQNYYRLNILFKKQDWHKIDYDGYSYERFCELLTNISSEQADLILELAENFIWLSPNQCEYSFFKLFKEFTETFQRLSEIEKIYVFPVMSVRDEKRTKSGHMMLYKLRALRPKLSKLKAIEIIEFETFSEIKKHKFSPTKDLIFLVDDFLGSSDTIMETLTEILKNRSIAISNIHVFTIASHQESVSFLNDYSITLHSSLTVNKGISDKYKGEEKNIKAKLMENIESMIKMKKIFKFGYKGCEALISLERTPDNTFPIFWHDYTKEKEIFTAPFPRY